MAKCGGCGKFMPAGDGIRCTKCPGAYHHVCVGMLATARTSSNWLCPGCKAKIPRTDNSTTPVKGASECGTDSSTVVEPAITVGSTGSAERRDPVPTATATKLSDCKDPASAAANTKPDERKGPAVVAVSTRPVEVKQAASCTRPTELNLAQEIRCFRQELGAMRDELREFKKEISDLRVCVSSYNERMDAVENKVSELEGRFEELNPGRYDQLEAAISDLKTQLNERDQDMLLNDIVITGIPETKAENPLHLLKLISVKLGVAIDERDIVNIERIGMVRRNHKESNGAEESRPRVLIARLSRRATRDQLLKAARVRRGLTTADIDLRGQPRKFYINERLTSMNAKLFFNARVAGQQHKYRYVWTKDGRIYVRKEDGNTAQRVRCDLDLARIFNNTIIVATPNNI